MNMFDKIDYFMRLFPTIHKDVSDMIYNVVQWDDETRIAFKTAKEMFEETLPPAI